MNKYQGMKIEYHILQSFPVTCLNRDDVGAPKTAVVGGVTRARVSSQSWKRQVRVAMQDFGVKIGMRTKHVKELIAAECRGIGATEEQANNAAEKISGVITKDTLHFFTESELKALAEYAKAQKYNISKEKEIIRVHKDNFNAAVDGLDIALFGRMAALAAELNVEAACSFAHAISTHKVSNEIEFFTALDDKKNEEDADPGSSHMGTLEYNSATYYRYVGLDLGQLVNTLGGGESINQAVEAFTKALYIAVPSARQTTQAGYSPWDYARVFVRKGQGLQASFEEPVRSKGCGYLLPSINRLDEYLEKKEKLSGSLFGKIQDFTWGQDENFSIDDLISNLQSCIEV